MVVVGPFAASKEARSVKSFVLSTIVGVFWAVERTVLDKNSPKARTRERACLSELIGANFQAIA
jgi:hypothetical protein